MKSIRVNPIACEGRGLCAELFPERIVLDDWGYPIVDETPIPPSLEHHARRAATMCPALALALGKRANTRDEPRLESRRTPAVRRRRAPVFPRRFPPLVVTSDA